MQSYGDNPTETIIIIRRLMIRIRIRIRYYRSRFTTFKPATRTCERTTTFETDNPPPNDLIHGMRGLMNMKHVRHCSFLHALPVVVAAHERTVRERKDTPHGTWPMTIWEAVQAAQLSIDA